MSKIKYNKTLVYLQLISFFSIHNYLLHVFANWNFNPGEWSGLARFIFTMIELVIIVVSMSSLNKIDKL